MFKILKNTYKCNVDVEFTVNFFEDNTYKINLLQCRPFQVKKGISIAETIPELSSENLIIKAWALSYTMCPCFLIFR